MKAQLTAPGASAVRSGYGLEWNTLVFSPPEQGRGKGKKEGAQPGRANLRRSGGVD